MSHMWMSHDWIHSSRQDIHVSRFSRVWDSKRVSHVNESWLDSFLMSWHEHIDLTSVVCETLIFSMRDTNLDIHVSVRHESFLCETRILILMFLWDTNLFYMRHESFLCETRIFSMWVMTRDVRHESFLCDSWLIYTWDMTQVSRSIKTSRKSQDCKRGWRCSLWQVGGCTHSKEPYIHSKEPYLCSKEIAKEVEDAFYGRWGAARALQTPKRALRTPKKALHIPKRDLYTPKRALHTIKRDLHTPHVRLIHTCALKMPSTASAWVYVCVCVCVCECVHVFVCVCVDVV